MKNEDGEKPLTVDDVLQENKLVQKEWNDAEKRFQNEKFGKQIWRVIALAILCTCLYNNKHRIVWVPDPNSRTMRVDVSDWWGIKNQTFYPVWRKPSGEQGRDSEQWCIKYTRLVNYLCQVSARGLAHSKTFRSIRKPAGIRASVLDCGGPPPLFPGAPNSDSARFA